MVCCHKLLGHLCARGPFSFIQLIAGAIMLLGVYVLFYVENETRAILCQPSQPFATEKNDGLPQFCELSYLPKLTRPPVFSTLKTSLATRINQDLALLHVWHIAYLNRPI